MLKKVGIICIMIVFIVGCKKYPDDEHIHLFTAQHRLTNHTWHFQKWENVTSYSYSFLSSGIKEQPVTFYGGGTCEGGGTWSYTDGNGFFHSDPYLFNFNGTWEFLENKDKIRITHNSNHSTVWNIYELDKSVFAIANDSIKYYFEKS